MTAFSRFAEKLGKAMMVVDQRSVAFFCLKQEQNVNLEKSERCKHSRGCGRNSLPLATQKRSLSLFFPFKKVEVKKGKSLVCKGSREWEWERVFPPKVCPLSIQNNKARPF